MIMKFSAFSGGGGEQYSQQFSTAQGQINLVHPTTTYFSETHLKLYSHLSLDLPIYHFPTGFPTNFLHYFPNPHARYMFHPSRPLWFDHPNNNSWVRKLWSFSLCSFLHSAIPSSFLSGNNIVTFLCLKALFSLRNISDQVLRPYKTTDKNFFLFSFIFGILLCNDIVTNVALYRLHSNPTLGFIWSLDTPRVSVLYLGHL
jgi:hypothetical protein